MMKVIDAHIHIPTKQKDPFGCLADMVNKENLSSYILVLNSSEDKKKFFSEGIFRLESTPNYGVALLADLETQVPMIYFETLKEHSIPAFLKIHPRLSHIVKEDFPLLLNLIKSAPVKTIIVDCFPYGPDIESHIGIELSIFLAQQLPEKNIVMAHSGGIKILEAMMYTRPVPNIYMEMSFTCNYLLKTSVEKDMVHLLRHSSHKVLFGSDYPGFLSGEALEAMMGLCQKAELSENQIKNVLFNTAENLYFT